MCVFLSHSTIAAFAGNDLLGEVVDLFDNSVSKLAGGELFAALDLSVEVVGDCPVDDRLLDGIADEVGGIVPPEVIEHFAA